MNLFRKVLLTRSPTVIANDVGRPTNKIQSTTGATEGDVPCIRAKLISYPDGDPLDSRNLKSPMSSLKASFRRPGSSKLYGFD